jgi:membrane-bound inhibitor of C-type lysozyme
MAVNYPSSFDSGSAPGLRTVNNVTDRRDFKYMNAMSPATAMNLTAASVATTTTLPNTPTWSSANGTLTATGTAATLIVDGISITSTSTRVLVKNQASGSGASNGIYVLSTIGGSATTWVLTRVADFNEDAEIKRFSTISVTSGTVNASTKWYLSNQEPITINTSNITWTALPSTVTYNSAAKYPTDVNVGVENISTQTNFVGDFQSILNTLEYEINAIQTSFASVTGIGASFIAASNILSIRNLKSKADKYVFELKRLRGDIDRMNSVGFPGNNIVGMGLTSRYPSGQHRGWGPN